MIKTFIEEYDGWPGKNVSYFITYDNGDTQKVCCSKLEWEAMNLKDELMSILTKWSPEKGEKLLDQYLEKVTEIVIENEWMSNMGEDL